MSQPVFSLKGKIAIVTGCRRGIGKAIALGLAGSGADVVCCDFVTNDGELEEVITQIQALGCRSMAVKADVTNSSDVDKLVNQVLNKFNKIDILVNNVGVMVRKPIMEYSEAEWDRVLNVNLKSAFLCSQAVSRIMVTQNRGSIINLSSVCAIKVSTTRGAYHIAKAGVSMLTKVLALELADKNVRVNAIAPGGVKTDWNVWEWDGPENELKPMKRMAESNEIVGGAIFLASDASSYITGHVLLIDGGESL